MQSPRTSLLISADVEKGTQGWEHLAFPVGNPESHRHTLSHLEPPDFPQKRRVSIIYCSIRRNISHSSKQLLSHNTIMLCWLPQSSSISKGFLWTVPHLKNTLVEKMPSISHSEWSFADLRRIRDRTIRMVKCNRVENQH